MSRSFGFALLLGLLGFVPAGHAAIWYVDNAATGLNNGSSWANAWTNNASINWGVINPGDTLKISGGATSKTYRESIIIKEDGTFANRLTIQNGQDAGHNGVIDMGTNVIMFSDATPRFVTLDFGRNPAFAAPTNWQQVIAGSTAITNNIGYRSRNRVGSDTGAGGSTSPAHFFFADGVSDLTLRWMEISGYTNNMSGLGTGLDPRGTIFYASIDPPQLCTNIVFEYLYLYNNSGQQFSWNGQNNTTTTNGMEFRFGQIDRCGEDHFEVGNGWTIRDSVIGPAFSGAVHNDHFQFTGRHFKVYNNFIGESYNAVLRLQSYGGGAGLTTNYVGDLLFYNNIMTEKPGRATHGGTLVEPICLVNFDSINAGHMIIWSNIVFANNLFANSLSNTFVSPPEMSRSPLIYFSRGNFITNAVFKEFKWVNNVTLNKEKGVSLPAFTPSPGGARPYTTNDVWADYNSQGLTADYAFLDNPRRMGYMDENVLDGSSAYSFLNNTNVPVFVNRLNENFELLPSDTVARDAGFNLSGLFNYDALNRPRNVGGKWDRGPLEYQGATQAPGAFNLTSPSSGAASQSQTLTLSWGASTGAASYHLEVDGDTAFTAPLVHGTTISGTSYGVPAGALAAGTTYFWRVRSSNAGGEVTAANAPFSFSTAVAAPTPPGAFTLSAPAAGASAVSLTPAFSWSDAAGEVGYVLELDTESSFAVPLTHSAPVAAGTLNYQLPGGMLANSTFYHWRVRATNAAGSTTAGGSPRTVTTEAAVPTPTGSVTNGLLVWLKFDDAFTDSRLEDSSGLGNHGYRFGRIGSSYPTNFPARVLSSGAAGTLFRTNLNGSDYAGDFIWHNTGYGIYGREGQYAGITNNMARFTNMARASIMCWARYESAPYGNNYSVDSYATLISAGTSAGVPGSWDLGRYNQNINQNETRFYVITNQATFAKSIIEFPDRGFDNDGDTANWFHYAITWDNGVIRGYFNGRPLATNDVSAVVTTLKVGRNPNVASPWIGVGCHTHAGTPWLDDEAPNVEYPNHGFMNGAIDDVRIYDRALSAAEVQEIVAGTAVVGPVKPSIPSGARLLPP